MNAVIPSVDFADLFARTREGNREARNELLTRLHDRLRRLTAKVLPAFPAVRLRRGVDSVVGDLFVKLIRALDAGLTCRTADDFLQFAGARLRTLLIDEAQKARRRMRKPPAGVEVPPAVVTEENGLLEFDVALADTDPVPLAIDTEDWERLLERTATELDADERHVVEQHLLLGIPQARIAAARGWPPRQVSRLWMRALDKLLPAATAA
jgi:RNA polymerase sigma factor (sigma-70 family)